MCCNDEFSTATWLSKFGNMLIDISLILLRNAGLEKAVFRRSRVRDLENYIYIWDDLKKLYLFIYIYMGHLYVKINNYLPMKRADQIQHIWDDLISIFS